VAIPALANKVLYWRVVYRDGSNNVITRGATNVQAVQ
jgi:hypothetical protein